MPNDLIIAHPSLAPESHPEGPDLIEWPGVVRAEDINQPYPGDPVRPVINADLGLGIRHIENSLLVIFERWSNLKEGDVFEFYMGNTRIPLAWAIVRLEDISQSKFHLSILRESLPLGLVFPCYGRVQRVGSGTDSTSPKQTWLIKDTRPGGPELPGLGYHDQLILHLPADLQVPGAIIDAERASEGVLCTINTYPEMRVRDVIELYWNRVDNLVTLTLDEDHINGLKPIEIWVSPERIEQGGSGLLLIRFRVHDEVLNYSGYVEQYSQAVQLQSDLDPNLLAHPFFLLDGADVVRVDYDKHADGHYEVEVVVPSRLPNNSLIPAGTQVAVTLSGNRADNSPLIVQLPAYTARPGRSDTSDVDNSVIKQLVNGSMHISYILQSPSGNVLATSSHLAVTVFGTLSSMPPLNVVEDDEGLVDPGLAHITFEFPQYLPYDPNYAVTLRMLARLPGGGVELYQQTLLAGSPPPPTRFRIVPRSEFARFIGLGPVTCVYRVDDGQISVLGAGALTVRESAPLTIQFGEGVAQMPAPQLEGVDEYGNLDPADITGQAIVTLPFSQTFAGDRFSWRWIGTGVDGSTQDDIILNGATAGKPVQFPVSKTYIDRNNNHEIRLSYTLVPASGGPVLRSQILVVTVGTALGNLIRPEVLQASREPDQLTPEAATTGATLRVSFIQMLPSDRIRACWTGIPGIGSHCETKDGNSYKSVDFHVPADVVGANISPFGQAIRVQYFLIRGSRETPSQPLDLLLLNLNTLPIPTIEGIGESSVLDLSRLNGTERTMINRWHFIHRDQRMWMEYRAEYADGRPYFEATYSNNPVTPDGELNGIHPPTPVGELRKLMNGSLLTISFWVSFDRSANKANAVLFREQRYLVQALPSVLPYPFIGGASGTGPSVTVEPLAIENNMRVSVKYAGMNSADWITLEVVFQDCSTHTVSLNGLDGGTQVFNLSNEILARCVNSTVTLRYTVLRGGEPIPSHNQTVRFNSIPINLLPQPLINNIASGGSLDLSTITGNPTVAVRKWSLSAKGQRVWLICSSAGVADLYVLDGYPMTATEAVSGLANKAVSRAWLAAVADGRQITVTCKVTFDGSQVESQAVPFQVATYTVVAGKGIIGTINIPSSYLAITPDGSILFATRRTASSISVIDTTTNQIIHTIGDLNTPEYIAMHPDGSRFAVVTDNFSRVTIVSTTRHTTIATLTNFRNVKKISYSPDGALLYVPDYSNSSVYVYSASTNSRVDTISVSAATCVGINPSRSRLYVGTEEATNKGIAVFNGTNNTLIRYIPQAIAATSVNHSPRAFKFYSLSQAVGATGGVTITNSNNEVLSRRLTGMGATFEIAFNPNTDRAYIPAYSDNTLLIIDTNIDAVIDSIGGFNRPFSIATPSGRNIAYITNTGELTIKIVQL